MSNLSLYEIWGEAVARFPNSESRQLDFVNSWIGIRNKCKAHRQRSDNLYGIGRKSRNKNWNRKFGIENNDSIIYYTYRIPSFIFLLVCILMICNLVLHGLE